MWEIEFLDQGVLEEFERLPAEMRAHYLRIIEMIQRHGPRNVGMLFIRALGNSLWEIRFRGKEGIARAIYVPATGRRLIVLHIFVKKTQKTPKRALDLARRRGKEAGLL
jgi:phage-related protein